LPCTPRGRGGSAADDEPGGATGAARALDGAGLGRSPMLGTRVIVGAVLALLALVVTVHGGWPFFVVALAVALIGINEFSRMMRPYRPLVLAAFVGAALMAVVGWTRSPQALMGVAALSLLLSFGLAAIPGPKPGVSVRIAITMLGLVYVGFGVGHLELIRRLADGQGYALMVVFGAWAGDTVAYFTGRYFGATPMAPRLSPKKTWEGFVGGFIGTVLMVVFIGLYYHAIGELHSLLIGVTIGVIAPIGDLFESLLKRDVEIKDAGRFFPGHGGLLDRFDGLLFAAVASYYLILALH
jgi:phosphatidate cytidylyltransferase